MFNAIAKKKNFESQLVGFDHHMICEILINGKWCYFDPNLEVELEGEQRGDSALTNMPRLLSFYNRL